LRIQAGAKDEEVKSKKAKGKSIEY